MLITGDMAGSTERKLVGQYDLPDIEVLMVGHHGSRYSSSQELLQAVRPETAIISVGDNSYGHPTQEAMDRLSQGGSGDLPHRPAGKYFSDRTRRRLTMPPKAEKKNNGFDRLRADLKAQTPQNVYLFYGEETYLRSYYLEELHRLLIPAGFEEFNYHRLSGKGLTVQELAEVTEAMPMMAQHTMVVVTDLDIFRLDEQQRTALMALLADFPEYCTLVLVYDLLPYKRDGKMKKLCAALDKSVCEVEFRQQERAQLLRWVKRRFAAAGHDIDDATADHLLFTCGSLMTELVPEIGKIAAYAKGRAVTVEDINAVADPVLDARALI